MISGEGGALLINDEKFIERAEIIWEKGTNRQKFFRGEIDKYSWVDIGSSFLPSDIIAAYLYAQLESIHKIQKKRCNNWEKYYNELKPLEDKGYIKLPYIPDYATNNGHMFYIVCKNENERDSFLKYMKENDILSVFHYLSLHKSEFYKGRHNGRGLVNSDNYTACLARLPMYYELSDKEVNYVCENIFKFYEQ